MLDKLFFESKKNKHWLTVGIDTYDLCHDKEHFNSYPHDISYIHNSRGFRDEEWPEDIDELKDAIWCFGDSYTTGVGSPLTHTWPNILQQRTGRRCITISQSGMSNFWMSRTIKQVQAEVNPRHIIVQWSTPLRYEDLESNRDGYDHHSQFYTTDTALTVLSKFEQIDKTGMYNSYIPDLNPIFDFPRIWYNVHDPSWPDIPTNVSEYNALPEHIKEELTTVFGISDRMIAELDSALHPRHRLPEGYHIKHLDYARDGFHYGILSATAFVDEILRSKFLES